MRLITQLNGQIKNTVRGELLIAEVLI